MTLSRQEDSPTSGRSNQKARTRAALVSAAAALVREGRPPSIPEAADRALVSVATAYRYFSTAEELWEDATVFTMDGIIDRQALAVAIEAEGDDIEARADVLARDLGGAFIDNPELARRAVKYGLDRWFANQDADDDARSVRPAERNQWNELVVKPLRGRYPDRQVDGLVEALGLVIGVEVLVTLLDVLRLSPKAALARQRTTARWIVRSGLADMGEQK